MGNVKMATQPQISFIQYSAMMNWSVRYLIENNFGYSHKYTLFNISDFLQRNRNTIVLEDEVLYSRVTIKLYNKGVLKRDEALGKDIGTKKQYLIKPGQFILSKIDARNGAFGIVPEDLNGAITTADFLSYEIDSNKINPYFLKLLTSTNQFLAYCQGSSSGTTGRQRINEQFFLNAKIPLPSIEIQNSIAETYNQKTQLAERQEQEAIQLGYDIEDYLFDVLGVEKLAEKESKQGLQFASFKGLKRWDVLAKDLRIIKGLSQSKFKLKKIGNIYSFPTRAWKNDWDSNTFNYVELGTIDPSKGICHSKVIKVKDAPSRATQVIYQKDLIIGTTRPYLKRFAIVSHHYDKHICSSGFCIISSSVDYNLIYLREFLMSYFGIEQLKNKMTGATYPAITNDALKEIKVPLPPLKMQNKIANTVERMKSEIKVLQEQALRNRRLAIEAFEKGIFQ